MNVHDSLYYRRSVKREKELRDLLIQLDQVGEVLYNNLEYDGIWEIIEALEDARIKYYVEHYEHKNVIANKGKMYE